MSELEAGIGGSFDPSLEAYFGDIRASDDGLISAEKELELGRLIAEGSPRESKRARTELTLVNLRLVVSVAKSLKGNLRNSKFLSLNDLIQEGNLGLLRAVDGYDYKRGYRFCTYACWWIRHAILRSIQDRGGMVRKPVHLQVDGNIYRREAERLSTVLGRPPTEEELAQALGYPLEKLRMLREAQAQGFDPFSLDAKLGETGTERTFGDLLEDPAATPEELLIKADEERLARTMVSALPPKQVDILLRRLGSVGQSDGCSLDDIGARYGVSRERARQLQEEALTALRKKLHVKVPEVKFRICSRGSTRRAKAKRAKKAKKLVVLLRKELSHE